MPDAERLRKMGFAGRLHLEEHNDFDGVGWADTLMPATQCGNVAPDEADTQLEEQNLCQPVGSTGGN
jgi:hypothetical protein